MAWVRLDDTVPRHHKFLAAGPAASWFYVCGLAHCQSLSTDGFIGAPALPFLGVAKGYQKLAAQLVTVHLWERVEGGYQVHDYFEHNRTDLEAHTKQAEKREARRQAGIASGRARRLAREQIEALNQPRVEHNPEQVVEHNPEQDVEHTPNTATEQMLNPDPTRPDPTRPDPTQEPDKPARALSGPHAKHAWCSRRGKCVQGFLHEEFMQAVGGPRRAADACLRNFYGETEARWPPSPIGDDPLVLWRREFAAAFPSIAPRMANATVTRRAGGPVSLPRVRDDVWGRVLDGVRHAVNRHSFYTWFEPTELVHDGGAVIQVAGTGEKAEVITEWIQRHYADVVREAVEHVRPGARVEFVVERAPAREAHA